ncbi:hypothetical protein MG293_020743 [Ovis ammon polii]|uniref:Uncharacterized protein n=1 Tax=Ovis ammon polii TaxID=230172 RepID=A0AAD4XXB7_OVIAM|nr:hypothetical protein MG293_020743 [Ovis ammon polii]
MAEGGGAARRRAPALLEAARARYESLHISDDVFGESGPDSGGNPFYSTSAASRSSSAASSDDEPERLGPARGPGSPEPGAPTAQESEEDEAGAGWSSTLRDRPPPHFEDTGGLLLHTGAPGRPDLSTRHISTGAIVLTPDPARGLSTEASPPCCGLQGNVRFLVFSEYRAHLLVMKESERPSRGAGKETGVQRSQTGGVAQALGTQCAWRARCCLIPPRHLDRGSRSYSVGLVGLVAQYDVILIVESGMDALPAPVPVKPRVQSWPLPTAGGIDQSGVQEARTVGPHRKRMIAGAAGETGCYGDTGCPESTGVTGALPYVSVPHPICSSSLLSRFLSRNPPTLAAYEAVIWLSRELAPKGIEICSKI